MAQRVPDPVAAAAAAATAAPGAPQADHRDTAQPAFVLVELPATEVVDGDITDEGLLAEDVTPAGQMREHCPHCGLPLQLVLRYRHVIRTHLFCDRCSRCFDARLPDGSSALTGPALPIY